MIVYQNTSHLGCFPKKCKAAEQNSENGAKLLSTDSQATFGPGDVRFFRADAFLWPQDASIEPRFA